MFGPNYEMAIAMTKERLRAACCAGAPREWCQVECRTVPRHG